MKLQNLIKLRMPVPFYNSEDHRRELAKVSLANALGVSLRQLERRITGKEKIGIRPLKPQPHFRSALVARQKKESVQ